MPHIIIIETTDKLIEEVRQILEKIVFRAGSRTSCAGDEHLALSNRASHPKVFH
jgi:hypothetical protein